MPFVPAASGNEIHVAVAANFYNPFRQIVKLFEEKTDHQVKIISGSTGKLYAQIRHGAPFELFLAADSRRPRLLEKEGDAVPGTRLTYALGRIALWSADSAMISPVGTATLRQKNFSHLAIANPKTAPYGKAAVQTLKQLGLWSQIRPQVVQGENISQTFQFVSSENAQLGFVARSQILDPKNSRKGSRWDVPESFHDPLEQDVVLLQRGKDNPGAQALWRFLREDAAQRIITNYGYELPGARAERKQRNNERTQ